jgi:methionyl-tRNA formyltransferase
MVADEAPRCRIAFFGTPDFAVPTLRALVDSRHQVVAAVTQPDRPRGRGQRVSPAPVKRFAQAHGVPVLQPDRVKDEAFLDQLRALGPDLGVVAAYGRILPDALIALPRLGTINVHASLLPKYRGAAPVHRAVIAGESETGVTIMRVVRALDAGPMLARAVRPIGVDETSEELERALATLGAGLLVETLDPLLAGTIDEIEQRHEDATYAPRLAREDGRIDWSRPAKAIHDLVRGLHPWPHAWSYLDSSRILVLRTAIAEPRGLEPAAPGMPGEIVRASGADLVASAGDRELLRILELQLEGKRPVTAREFLAGHPVRPGARFAGAPA